MSASGIVSINDNCCFFDIRSTDTYEIANPSHNLARVLGRDAEGMNYIDLVCPEDKEAVTAYLQEIFEEGQSREDADRHGRCIRHRLLLPDGEAVTVSLTFGYNPRGYLICSVMRLFADLGGEAENKYRSNNVLESFAISMAIVYINDDDLIAVKYANNEFYSMIGWNRLEFNDFFNECLTDVIIHPDDYAAFHLSLTSMSSEKRESVFETRVLHTNGDIRVNEVRTRFLEMENGKALISVIFSDITERKQLRKELMIKNERFNIIQTSSEQTIFDYDTEKDVCVLSGSKSRIEKYLSVYSYNHRTNEISIEEFFNARYPLNIMSKEAYGKMCDAFANAIVDGKDGELEFELWIIGQSFGTWFKCAYSAVKDDSGSVIRIVGRLKNIDKQKKAEQLIEKRMKTDGLTGLLNKDTAKDEIREYLSSQKSSFGSDDKYHVLLILDLDNFHFINECFGHTFGDNVLKEFASDIKSSFRTTDIVGRLVGDRFLVLMKNVTEKFAVKKAGRLCRSLIKSFGVQNTVTVSCSIGVAFFGRDAFDFEELYQYAECATYEAKKNGKCAYFIYDSELQEDYSRMKEIAGSTSDSAPVSQEAGEIDTNLIDIAFSLLSTSDDTYGTLDILLRTVGRKYNLSAVSILAKNYGDNDRLQTVSRWISTRNASDREGRSPLVRGRFDFDGALAGSPMRCINDINNCNMQPTLKNTLRNDGMNALVICALEGRGGENFGYLICTQFDRKRKWSQKETGTFRYLAKIISVALAEKYASGTLDLKSSG